MNNTVLLGLLLSSTYDVIVTTTPDDSFTADFGPSQFDFDFGRRIADARKRADLSQRWLAEQLGKRGLSLDSAALSRMENGKRSPKLEEAVAIADILGLPLSDMLPARADAMRLARARYNVEHHLDNAMYKLTGAASYLEYLASLVEADPDLAQALFRDSSPEARFDWESWATWTVDSLAASPQRRIQSATDQRAHAIKRVLRALADAVVTAPVDMIDTSDGVGLRTRRPRPAEDQADGS